MAVNELSHRYFGTAVAGRSTHVIRRESKRELEPENYLAGLLDQIEEADEEIAAYCDIEENDVLKQLVEEIDELIEQELKETLAWATLYASISWAGLFTTTDNKDTVITNVEQLNKFATKQGSSRTIRHFDDKSDDKKDVDKIIKRFSEKNKSSIEKEKSPTHKPEQQNAIKRVFFLAICPFFMSSYMDTKIDKINALCDLRKKMQSGYFAEGDSAKNQYNNFQARYAVIYNSEGGVVTGYSRLNQAFMTTFTFMRCRVEEMCKRVNKKFCVKLDDLRKEKSKLQEKLEWSKEQEKAIPMTEVTLRA